MKKLMGILFILILCSTFAYADEVDQGLPGQTSGQLKESTREMIRLGVQAEDALNMTRTMVQNRFREENVIAAQQVIMNAKKQGLSEKPIMNKAYEGIAKKVQAGSIVQAMERTRERYAYAHDKAKTLGGSIAEPPATGDIIAQGMAAGLKNSDVDAICDRLMTRDRIRDTTGDEDATKDQIRDRKRDQDQTHTLAQESFLTVRDMVRRGVPSEVAADAVGQAIQNNYRARDMQQMRYSFMHNADSSDPVQLANRYANALRQGANPDDLDSGSGSGSMGTGSNSGTSGNGSSSGSGSGSSGAGGGNGSGSGGNGAGGPGSGSRK